MTQQQWTPSDIERATEAERRPPAKTQKGKALRKWWEEHAEVSTPLVEELLRIKGAMGLSDAEVSRRSGVTTTTLRNWNRKKVRPLLSTVAIVAKAMGRRIAFVEEH